MKITLRDLFWLTLVTALLLYYGLPNWLERERILQRELAERETDWRILRHLDAELIQWNSRAELAFQESRRPVGTLEAKARAHVECTRAERRLQSLEREIAHREKRLAIK
jgi:hypothetical protein